MHANTVIQMVYGQKVWMGYYSPKFANCSNSQFFPSSILSSRALKSSNQNLKYFQRFSSDFPAIAQNSRQCCYNISVHNIYTQDYIMYTAPHTQYVGECGVCTINWEIFVLEKFS